MTDKKPLEKRSRYCDKLKKTLPSLDAAWIEPMKCLEYLPYSTDMSEADREEWSERLVLLREDLHDLLVMPYEQFWCQVVFEYSVLHCVDSYLKHAPRWYDSILIDLTEDIKSLYDEVHRLVFMVLLRTSTYKESNENFMSPAIYGEMIYENYIFDVPKLMDLCVLFGNENAALVAKMVENIVSVQPKYRKDLRDTLLTICELFDRLCAEAGVSSIGTSDSPQKLAAPRTTVPQLPRHRFTDIVTYLLDTVCTLNAFILASRTLLEVFLDVHFDQSIASLYDNLIPYLRKLVKKMEFEVSEQTFWKTQLARISGGLIKIFRAFMEPLCLNPLLDASGNEEKGVLVEKYVTLMSNIMPYKQFVAALQLNFPLDEDINMIQQTGAANVIDTTRVDYLEASVRMIMDEVAESSAKSTVGRRKKVTKQPVKDVEDRVMGAAACKDDVKELTSAFNNGVELTDRENEVEGACALRAPTPPSVELESLISAVRDILPDLGEGFVQTCLAEYDFNTEKVINAILENSLHPYLQLLDQQMPAKIPGPSASGGDVPVLARGRGVYDGDEFDVFAGRIDPSLVHLGKRVDKIGKISVEEKRHIVEQYDVEEEEMERPPDEILLAGTFNLAEYDDEYDDTYDSTVAVVEPDSFKNRSDKNRWGRRNVPAQAESDEEEQTRPPRDQFIENPEVVRERLARQRAARGRGGSHGPGRGGQQGQGQSSGANQPRDRGGKERHKAQYANHNRRLMADKKRQKTGFY